MTSVRRGLLLSVAERYLLTLVAFGSTLIVARLLTPEQIGLYSVCLAILGVAHVTRDFGIGNFLVQARSVTDEHVRTAFGLSLFLGGVLFSVIYLAAPGIARFYGPVEMTTTLRISALNFLVLPFCTISLALLKRKLAFARITAVNIFAALTGTAAVLTLAYAGLGPNGLALGAVVGNVATGLGAWLATSDRKVYAPSLSEWRALASYGGQSTATGVITSISVDINDLAIAKLLGFAPVALLSRAQGLMNIFHRDFMASVRTIAFPAFARAHRDGDNLESHFTYSVAAVTAVAWPFYGFTALYSADLIDLLYGPQWRQAVPLVPWFCLAGAFAATWNLILPLINAVGRIDLVTKIELIVQPLRAAILVGVALLFESLLALSITFALLYLSLIPVYFSIKTRCLNTDYRALSHSLLSSAKIAIACLVLPAALRFGPFQAETGSLDSFIRLGVGALLCGCSWLTSIICLKHPIKDDPIFKRLLSTLRIHPRLFR